jgi:8-oxo-dGTP diphosphatase
MTAPRPLLGASICVFRGEDVLLILRGHAPFARLWSLPGGRVEFGERLEDAVRREALEETGLAVGDVDFVRLHEAIDAANGTHAVIAVFRARVALGAGSTALAGDDAAAVRFLSLAELEALAAAGQTTAGLAGVVRAAFAAHRGETRPR